MDGARRGDWQAEADSSPPSPPARALPGLMLPACLLQTWPSLCPRRKRRPRGRDRPRPPVAPPEVLPGPGVSVYYFPATLGGEDSRASQAGAYSSGLHELVLLLGRMGVVATQAQGPVPASPFPLLTQAGRPRPTKDPPWPDTKSFLLLGTAVSNPRSGWLAGMLWSLLCPFSGGGWLLYSG